MSEKVEKPNIKLIEDAAPESVFDDIETLRKVATLKVERRVLDINVTVLKRPPDNVYFRVHPDPDWSLDSSIIKGDDETYFVWPAMLNYPVIFPRLKRVTICTVCMWPGNVIALWTVPVVDSTSNRIACWKSARVAYESAKTQWVQVCWNGERRDYDVSVASGINVEPVWPDDKGLLTF
jgi:hypothetical protein